MSQPQPETPICGECDILGAVNCSEHGTTREDLSATKAAEMLAESIDTIVRQFTGHDGALPEFVGIIRSAIERIVEQKERENNQLRAELEQQKDYAIIVEAAATNSSAANERLRTQLSDEQAARTEITRKYHDECAKLARELTTTQARLAESIKVMTKAKCSGEFTTAAGAALLMRFLSSTEPPAILKELERIKSESKQRDEDSHLVQCEIEKQQRRAESAEAKLTELGKDKARLDKVFLNGWQISYNSRAQAWIVQQQFQSVGNIGKGSTLREAIDAAMKQT